MKIFSAATLWLVLENYPKMLTVVFHTFKNKPKNLSEATLSDRSESHI